MSDYRRSNVARALLADAVAQVLDNKVFRILAVLSALIVALTFAIGFREDSIWLLGGLREYFYEDLFSFFGATMPVGGTTQQEAVISFLQKLFVDYLAGYVGILFCIGATAFFVPAMLEKGFADTLFSKPVSRWSLLLSRYLAALLFIAFLSAFLVGGMHLGLSISSGYSDPSFLWSAITLVYLFALISSFSVLFGTFTRSTVAALLLTFAAYGVTTGVHNAWIPIQMGRELGAFDELEKSREEGRSNEVADTFIDGLIATAETLHYILPKTVDAKYITADLRDQVISDPEEARARSERRSRRGAGGDDDSAEAADSKAGGRASQGRRSADLDPWTWYETKVGWDASLPFNFGFSIASSLVFVGAALGLAWLRLRRISF
ncbi:ABC transporter permease [Engelhardtia mirabilis]|uniref:ABC-2 family transporter protein n=1 Tax=Engelhardtia mirabilis TaxID=2528011 RepID=A0A518BQP6_9BACT|nr:ABC-2 family transporter protein [Planctomycetes bacterium Pla133]QDV03615.1 ABC-2 family transporter protein [Planctomycetes bacterium Pla86]